MKRFFQRRLCMTPFQLLVDPFLWHLTKKKPVKMIAALCGKLIAEVGYYFLALNLPFYDPQLSVHLYNRRKGLKADLK